MYDELLQAVMTLVTSHASPYTTIDHGAMPEENGLAMYPGPGFSEQTHMDKGGIQIVYIVLNGKHSNLETLLASLSKTHRELSLLEVYPSGGDWEILNIETSTPPNYLGREDSGTRQWLYGSILRVTYYSKGV